MNKNALTVSGLTKKYKEFSLSDISFEVPRGTIVGLIGENGAGKSTTLNAILGVVHKDAGEISIMGNPIEELKPDMKEKIGVVGLVRGRDPDAARAARHLYLARGYILPLHHQLQRCAHADPPREGFCADDTVTGCLDCSVGRRVVA